MDQAKHSRIVIITATVLALIGLIATVSIVDFSQSKENSSSFSEDGEKPQETEVNDVEVESGEEATAPDSQDGGRGKAEIQTSGNENEENHTASASRDSNIKIQEEGTIKELFQKHGIGEKVLNANNLLNLDLNEKAILTIYSPLDVLRIETKNKPGKRISFIGKKRRFCSYLNFAVSDIPAHLTHDDAIDREEAWQIAKRIAEAMEFDVDINQCVFEFDDYGGVPNDLRSSYYRYYWPTRYKDYKMVNFIMIAVSPYDGSVGSVQYDPVMPPEDEEIVLTELEAKEIAQKYLEKGFWGQVYPNVTLTARPQKWLIHPNPGIWEGRSRPNYDITRVVYRFDMIREDGVLIEIDAINGEVIGGTPL